MENNKKKKLKWDGETIYEEMKMMCVAMQDPQLTLSAVICISPDSSSQHRK